jgi:hypothetical protein
MQVNEQTGTDGIISVANRSGANEISISLDTEFTLGQVV